LKFHSSNRNLNEILQLISTLCRDFRRREPSDESSADTKSRAAVGNQPACIYDCYSTGSGYQLSLPPRQRHADVIRVTGSDVIVHDAMTSAIGSTIGLDKKANCCTNETSLSASQVLYQPYIGSVV